MSLSLSFAVALPSEARPLIEHYRLERFDTGGAAFKIFRRDDVALVVSGLGKVAAAAAAAYLHLATGGVRQSAWLNVGIAGHGRLEVGEAVLANRVRDQATGKCWNPPMLFGTGLPKGEVVTVDRVERRFEDDAAYEMEASGFYPIARRFTTVELVHCLKVVSDGPGQAPERLSASVVERLIGDRLAGIELLADAARDRAVRTQRLPPAPF